MAEKNETTIFERLKDPFSIYSFLTLIIYIVMIILYFVLPTLKSYNYETQILTLFYWNGGFQEFVLPAGDLVSTGVSETYPINAHYILTVSIFLLLALSIAQISTVIFSKKLTKKNFLNIFIIPTFLFNSLLLFGIFSFIHWIRTNSSSKLTFNMETPLVFILLVGILLTIVILGFATTLTIIGKRKESRRIQLN
ncbi:MAG: hypothetical protein C5S38_07090 [Candidatus Methanophagaceae archaeon]|nr:MAG: hypothetical protein C5S38_07090 [Methanophagales archaeon]